VTVILTAACLAVVTLGARQLPPYAGAAEYVADLSARRARTMDKLGSETVAVFWSAPERVYSTDVNYAYRQDSTLLYLTGIDQPATILVLIPGATSTREVLFVRPGDPHRELWNGHVPTTGEASRASGISTVYPTPMFDGFMANLLGGHESEAVPAREFGSFFAAIGAGKARLAVLGGATPAESGRARATAASPAPTFAPLPAAPEAARAFADQARSRFPALTIFDDTSVFEGVAARRSGGRGAETGAGTPPANGLRAFKTPYEQTVLRHSAEISAEAHIEGMKAARPGRWEYEVQAAIEYWYLKNGAMSWGYPSIVGSGPNATTLHYESSSRQMKDGDLLLVDAAANFQGLTADITRTYPVGGKFTPAQRAIYDIVIAAQQAGAGAATAGHEPSDITAACRKVIGQGLFKLGLVTDATNATEIGWWFPHGASHGIGVDVHDPLQVIDIGTAFTIEPGIYIRQDTIDNLPKDPQTAAIVAAIQPAVNKYKDIGVRIEDSYLLTPSGLVTLSEKAPKQVADLEKIVGTRK
jgi:Xaa-Pro aminopeptidase